MDDVKITRESLSLLSYGIFAQLVLASMNYSLELKKNSLVENIYKEIGKFLKSLSEKEREDFEKVFAGMLESKSVALSDYIVRNYSRDDAKAFAKEFSQFRR